MAEKYLGEQGLAKLIELVKKNSSGSPIYVKSRKANEYGFSTSLYESVIHTFVVTVTTPVGEHDTMVNVYFNGVRSHTTFGQVFTFSQNGLWIIETYAVAKKGWLDFNTTLFYIGPDENAINSGDLLIHSTQQLV